MPETYLVVPVELDALVVNRGVLGRDTFRWWQFNYMALGHFKSPEPLAFDRPTGGPAAGIHLHWTLPRSLRNGVQNPQTGEFEYPLVPNRWLVLRFGGTTGRRATAGWVLESDCPKTSRTPNVDTARTSMYLLDPSIINAWVKSPDPYRNGAAFSPTANQPQIANIGIPFPLSGGWDERDGRSMFLTAVGPANHVFSVYYPHNLGVFSFYDDLAGVDADTLSYLVVGWYSDPTRDVLASWRQDTKSPKPYDALLDRLRWTVTGGSEAQATASLYEGMVFSIDWNRGGNPPPEDPLQAVRDSGILNVALGNTGTDSFTALVAEQFRAKGHDPQKAKLLQAFQYGLLPVLNQPNGEALLEEEIRRAWHGPKQGGYRWSIVPRDAEDTAADVLTADEAAWLLRLNNDQADLDDALEQLYGLQWDLNATWYRLNFLTDKANTFPQPPPGVPWSQSNPKVFNDYLAGLRAQLDPSTQLDPSRPAGPTNFDSLARRVVNQIAAVKALTAKVPQPKAVADGNAQDAFLAGVRAFATQKNLDLKKSLKAAAAPRYWKANNPVVTISGVEPPPETNPDRALDVRLASHLVTGFKVASSAPVDQTSAASALPATPDLSKLPAPVPSLVREFFFLDPAGAASIAAAIKRPAADVSAVMAAHPADAYLGTLPDLALDNWKQPWSPLFMEWRVSYTHIADQTDGQSNWTFDGTDYHFTPRGATPSTERPRGVGGISLLSPQAKFVFGARLKKFVDQFGTDADLHNLYDWIDEIDKWQFLSQELVGFNELLALRDERAFRRPSPADSVGGPAGRYPLADLVGYSSDAPGGAHSLPGAYRGQVNSIPFNPNGPKIPFRGVRQGQIYFEDLSLYDKFGRVLYVIQSGTNSGLFDMKNFPLVRDPNLDPDVKLNTAINSVAQLPPRLLQHARLDIDLVDGARDSKLYGLDPNVNPVCGWVLPNHLDRSILVYAPDGRSMGEFRMVVNERGAKSGEWQPPPHSEVNTLDDVGKVSPHLRQMLDSPKLKDPAAFQTFLDVIDATLWTTDALGNRADENLSVLIGRPLALVRARLQLALDGPAIRDTGWDVSLDPPTPDFLNTTFAVRLGDQATREDGVVGYFLGADYDTFNSVAAPGDGGPPQGYVKRIGPLGTTDGTANYIPLKCAEGGGAYVTLLVDPRAAVHATTGIVPVKEVSLPASLVEDPLTNIEVGFRVGPLLTAIRETPAPAGRRPAFPTAVSYPAPAEQNGQWSWWEPATASPGWNGYALLDTTPDAKLRTVPNTLRDGILQLVLDLNKDS